MYDDVAILYIFYFIFLYTKHREMKINTASRTGKINFNFREIIKKNGSKNNGLPFPFPQDLFTHKHKARACVK